MTEGKLKNYFAPSDIKEILKRKTHGEKVIIKTHNPTTLRAYGLNIESCGINEYVVK